MMEKRYNATTQNRFYPDMSNVNKNITVEAKLVRTVSICVFQVQYDGKEIQCDYTEPVLSRYV